MVAELRDRRTYYFFLYIYISHGVSRIKQGRERKSSVGTLHSARVEWWKSTPRFAFVIHLENENN